MFDILVGSFIKSHDSACNFVALLYSASREETGGEEEEED
jgi:hypothetical protein